MKKIYYIQRLLLPKNRWRIKYGLSDRTIETLKPIFSFDDMGCAEFDNGKIQTAIRRMEDHKNNNKLVFGSLGNEGNRIFYICNSKHFSEFKYLVVELIKGDESVNLKEPTCFSYAMKNYPSVKNLTGWFELESGLMFFKDNVMFEKTITLFEL